MAYLLGPGQGVELDFCLGGAPSSKLAEHGGFGGSQTLACQLGQKLMIDAVLTTLDRQLLRPQ